MTERSSRLTVGTGILLFALAPGLMLAQSEVAPEVLSQPPNSYPDLPSETPAKFEPVTGEFDHIRREVMISMRDGVRLFTVILVPKGVADAPILLTRTPYDADALRRHKKSPHLGPVLSGYDNAADLVVDGKMQIEALLSIVDCRDLIVWGTGEEELEAYRQTMGGRGLRIETTVDGDAIAATCNLIVTATPCHTPLLLAEQVRESTQITAMG